ncbi:MAG: GAF domain-containing protein [Chloroflexota bacterium]
MAQLARKPSKHKRAGRAYNNQTLLAGIVSSTKDAIIVADVEQHIVIFNEAAEKMFRCSASEALGRPLDRFIPERSRQMHREHARNFGETGSTRRPMGNAEVLMGLRADGHEFPLEAAIAGVEAGGQKFSIAILRDIISYRQRERELETIVALTAALRATPTRVEMLPLILDQILEILGGGGAALALRDPMSGEPAIELARGNWAHWAQVSLSPSGIVSRHVLTTGELYISNNVLNDPRFIQLAMLAGLHAVACFPLIVQERTIGILWVGRRGSAAPPDIFTVDELRLLTVISDIAANAIYRSTLYEQTRNRLQRLATLRTIDMAIAANHDLYTVLNLLLEGVLAQVGVHAADVLLLNPKTQTLEYVASRGFYTEALKHTRLPIDEESYAGRVVLELSVIHVSPINLERSPLLSQEGFIAYYGVPLIAKGHVRGVLEIFHRTSLQPDSDWFDFMESIVAQVAIAVDNAVLFDDLQRSLEALGAAQAQLIQAARLSAVGELAAGVAHQINNPLTTIIADAQLLLKSIGREHPGYDSADAIVQAGWRAQRVVQRLLNFSRPDEGEYVPTDVNATVLNALDLVRVHMERNGTQIQVNLASDLPAVLANGHYLEEVWINLLMNARDALVEDRPGEILLTSRLAPGGQAVEVAVKDNGRGISAADQEHIFALFFTTKGRNRGNGLGLPVCQSIIHNHGGEISFASAVDQGTSFVVRLPLAGPTAHRA